MYVVILYCCGTSLSDKLQHNNHFVLLHFVTVYTSMRAPKYTMCERCLFILEPTCFG